MICSLYNRAEDPNHWGGAATDGWRHQADVWESLGQQYNFYKEMVLFVVSLETTFSAQEVEGKQFPSGSLSVKYQNRQRQGAGFLK